MKNLSTVNRRLGYIDGLRALACISVLTLHAYMFAGQPEWRIRIFSLRPNPFRLLQFGSSGVHLFLILSGFCLFVAFAGPTDVKQFRTAEFASRRIWRILPAYYATLAVCLMLFPVHAALGRWTGLDFTPSAGPPTSVSLLLHMALLHGLYPPANLQINGPFWTLGLEWQFYLLFPLFVVLFHKLGAIQTTAGAIVVTLAYRAVAIRFVRHSEVMVQWDVISSNIPGRIGEFCLGMLAAWQVRRQAEVGVSGWWISATILVAVVFAIGGMLTAPFSLFNDLLWGAAYFALLKAVLAGPSLFRRTLSLRPMVSIGAISYSIYLIHLPILDLLRPLLVSAGHPIRSFAVLLVVGGAASVGLSAVFFKIFERPFLKGPPNWASRKRSEATSEAMMPAAEIAP